MPTPITSITNNVMTQIRGGRLRMWPRVWFILGTLIAMVGMIAALISSAFLFGLIDFSLRTHGPRGEERFAELVGAIPWWTLVVAVVGLVLGIFVMRRYTSAYRWNRWVTILIVTVVVFAAGWCIDALGFNDALLRHGQMNGFMRGYSSTGQVGGPGAGHGPWWAR